MDLKFYVYALLGAGVTGLLAYIYNKYQEAKEIVAESQRIKNRKDIENKKREINEITKRVKDAEINYQELRDSFKRDFINTDADDSKKQ